MVLTDQLDVFENDIDKYLHLFCEENDIANLRDVSQNVWNGCLLYIRRHVFKDKDELKIKRHISDNIPSTCNAYDINIVNDICDYYIYMCNLYDKEVSIMGFAKLTGINQDTIHDWGNGINKLSTSGCDVYKKLSKEREESLSAKLVTGKQNPVGVLGVLNRHYGWSQPGVTREVVNKGALPASELPKLGGDFVQIEQIPGDIEKMNEKKPLKDL